VVPLYLVILLAWPSGAQNITEKTIDSRTGKGTNLQALSWLYCEIKLLKFHKRFLLFK